MQNALILNIMELIKIEGTDYTPSVVLDPNNHQLNFSGRSLPEDTKAFFLPILEWLDDYANEETPKTLVEFKFDYFSTGTSKMIANILSKLEQLNSNGSDVLIRWYYPDDDEDIEEAGEIYSELVEVPFETVSYTVR